ncbi:MAG TPA: site-specific integrase [Tepidisphaeraceae bacterium]|nr:site-specific integrase [Tepidisphaeraceae bacterium]
MPRPKSLKPSYCHDKSSRRAFVTLNGKRVYLGVHGTAASRDEYDRVIGEWIASGRNAVATPSTAPASVTVSVVVAAFWQHAQVYYRTADGTPTSEVTNLRYALRPLRTLYGPTPAAAFGPLALKALQQHMVGLGWARTYINRQTNRLRHVFKWAASNELVPGTVPHALATVSGLRAGRTEAVESAPVRPVPDGILAATLPHLSRHVRAMADLQLLTGMRPGEVCAMRTCDLTRAGKVSYTPPQHKTKHHGHTREIRIGPKAQALLAPFLKPELSAHVFSPIEAEAERLEALHAKRKTPMSCGNRPGTNRQRAPKRQPRDRYTVTTYRRAIARACQRALGMPAELREPETKEAIAADTPSATKERRRLRSEWNAANVWHPHQLRHNAATLLRRQYGIEAARLILGHRSAAVTEIYAEMDAAKAEQIMAEVG